MAIFENFVRVLQSQGVYEFYFPFLLTFVIFFVLIRRSRVFGEDKTAKKINLIVSFVAACYVMLASPFAVPISMFFARLFAGTSVVLITLLVFFMIITMLIGPIWSDMVNLQEFWKKNLLWFVAIAFILVLVIFSLSGGINLFGLMIPPDLGLSIIFPEIAVNISGEDVALILLLIATGLLIYLMIKEDTGEQPSTPQTSKT